MTAVPILAGVYADSQANLFQSYPINLEPQFVDSGISKGYLRSAPGVAALAIGPGADRGSINWNGICYRVMGTRLISVDLYGTVKDLGHIAGGGPVAMDLSFTLLGIVGGGNLYYWDGSALTQVTDPDLGSPIDMLWVDGYFFMTDGRFLIVTELNDPYSIDPLKYGSSEEDPDPITGLMKVRGEVYAVNLTTIENFQNIGGLGFPFTRNSGGLIPKGAVGTKTKSYISQTFAFVGQARNEKPSVYLAGAGQATSVSTPQIDHELGALTPGELAGVEMETRVEENQERLLIHLPNRTLVYSVNLSASAQTPIWYYVAGGVLGDQPYPCRHLCLLDGVWIGGDALGRIGTLDNAIQTQYGIVQGWQFDTLLIYNGTRGGIIKALELVGLPGRGPFGVQPTAFLSMTFDGQSFGQERAISMGNFGQRGKRVQWRPKVHFWNYVGLRFRGSATAVASFAGLEADIEGLAG